jgi:formylglycine-generating enzyme required for sulfatase activity
VDPPGPELVLTIPGSDGVQLRMRRIPAGEFLMGDPEWGPPVRPVRISRPFYIGVYEVTGAQWQAVWHRPSAGSAEHPENPVDYVSWDDCQEFIGKLNELGIGEFRLPTDAEWEYAYRAGLSAERHFGGYLRCFREYAWCLENSSGRTHTVGTKRPNRWGLYDMFGNVAEWCADLRVPYSPELAVDPVGNTSCYERTVRGDSWRDSGWMMVSTSSVDLLMRYRQEWVGFRLVRLVEESADEPNPTPNNNGARTIAEQGTGSP